MSDDNNENSDDTLLEDGPDTAPGNASATATITIFAKDRGKLTKRISLVDGKVKSDGSECQMSTGTAWRVQIHGIADLAAKIEGLADREALALGTLRAGLQDRVKVVTAAKLNGRSTSGVIARTHDFLVYEERKPAPVLFDFDQKDIPPAIAERVRVNGYWETLVEVLPDLRNVTHIIRKSTSAGLSRSDTNEPLPGSGGLHVYAMAQDGKDIPEFLKIVHMRSWLHGLGWIALSRAGSFLERSIVDFFVGDPSRLVFEAAPIVMPPIIQDIESRKPIVVEGMLPMLNTYAACPSPPPDGDEWRRYKELVDAAKQAKTPEATRVREAYIETHATKLRARKPDITVAEAIKVIGAQCQGILLPDVVLAFDDTELAGLTVGDVLDEPQRFAKCTLADPIEGVEYGRGKAIVLLNKQGRPWIKSFAHGDTRYTLRREAPDPNEPREDDDEPPPQPPLFLTSKQFVDSYVPLDYLIEGILVKSHLYSLTAPTGDGKTSIALRLTAHVAHGMPLDGREVLQGKVLFFAGENPIDVLMRWVKLCDVMGIDPNCENVIWRSGSMSLSKEELRRRIEVETKKHGPFALIVIDTSAAFFEGDDENSNAQMGAHARMFRSLIDIISGAPCILVTTHPIKNPDPEWLIPRGGGAFVNEVDTNLVVLKQGNEDVAEVYWHVKKRVPDFRPIPFKMITGTTERIVDSKGRRLITVYAQPISETEQDAADDKGRQRGDELLWVMKNNSNASLRELAVATKWQTAKGEPNVNLVRSTLRTLKNDKLAHKHRGRWVLTKAGLKAAQAPPEGNNDLFN